jgi:hypothetical protein
VGGPSKILDTKWKLPGIAPDSADLKQVFAYNEFFGTSESVLLYPRAAGTSEGFPQRTFVGHSHGCSVAFLNLFDEAGTFSIAAIQRQLTSLLVG